MQSNIHAERASSDRVFLGASALLFLVSAGTTIYLCSSMSGGMPMPGGWTMSMAWMRMAGQSGLGAALSFLGMWFVMMIAMMLPALVPMLSSYRRSLREAGETRLGFPTAMVGAGYFCLWGVLGVVAYPVGLAFAAREMQSPELAGFVPLAVGVVVLLGGFFQLTKWKARQLKHCEGESCCPPSTSSRASSAWRLGMRLGVRCGFCCLGFMVILLAKGVMSLSAMAVVAAAITAERFVAKPELAARAIGFLLLAAGAVSIGLALGLTRS